MMIPTYFLIYLLVILQFNSDTVLSQRDFANPAVTDPAPCACDVHIGACDPNCCCDSDCDDSDLSVSPVCQSTRTVSSYSSSEEQNLQIWNCSNSTSAALYDYFPFVCVQLKLNEVIGKFYSTDNITFLTQNEDATDLRSTFLTEHPELFQPTILPTATSVSTVNYSIGAPIRRSVDTLLTLPGNLGGSVCQENAYVLFGVNRDVSCSTISLANLCSNINSVTSVWAGGGSNSNVSISFFTKTYVPPTTNPRNPTTEYYFQDSYSLTINNIPYINGSINDYCPGRHPLTRTQRYSTACTTSDTSLCDDQYQRWSGCRLRDSLKYSTINDTFFTAGTSSIDDPTNFADFDNATNATGTPVNCASSDIRRVFYRFNYSSVDNTISTADVFVLIQNKGAFSFVPRITIEWNDIANTLALNTTVPNSYADGEVLQFRRNNAISDVSTLVPTSTGYCIDATRTTVRYKQSTSSYCFVQLTEATIEQCHDLKLNMYLYLNVFYAPASHVLAYPNPNATLIPIRDDNQDSMDLDRIDETRPNNRLSVSSITQTKLNVSTPTIYDATETLPVCFDVPSGVYIEFGYVRVQISPTVSFERIVSVQYNYSYSNWQFDCTAGSCTTASTQKYLVTFQSAFVDYTNAALNFSDLTRADITSADNYIQHLLWLITPEYKGEPGYRNYTIAMILIFIAISVVVIHVLLFGMMCPF